MKLMKLMLVVFMMVALLLPLSVVEAKMYMAKPEGSTLSPTEPAYDLDPIPLRLVKVLFCPVIAVGEFVVSIPKNIIEKDGINIPKAIGRSALNAIGRPVSEVVNLFKGEEICPYMKNNGLAENNLVAGTLGWGIVGGACVAPAGNLIHGVEISQTITRIVVPFSAAGAVIEVITD